MWVPCYRGAPSPHRRPVQVQEAKAAPRPPHSGNPAGTAVSETPTRAGDGHRHEERKSLQLSGKREVATRHTDDTPSRARFSGSTAPAGEYIGEETQPNAWRSAPVARVSSESYFRGPSSLH